MNNNKYKIIALFGPAGSGKDYIQKNIIKSIWGKNNLNEIISYTTRPPRQGEKNGINYFFTTERNFFDKINSNNMIEFSVFRSWFYGTSIDTLNINKINIGVFNIEGIKTLLKKTNCEILPIYVKALPKIRLLRQLTREQDPDCDEIIRRYLTDKQDFLNIPFEYKIVENDYDEIEPVISDIFYFVRNCNWS